MGALEDARAESKRDTVPKICSTSPSCPRMMKPVNQHQRDMNEVPPARFPEEPGAVVPHAGICDGDVGELTFLPQSPQETESHANHD